MFTADLQVAQDGVLTIFTTELQDWKPLSGETYDLIRT